MYKDQTKPFKTLRQVVETMIFTQIDSVVARDVPWIPVPFH